MISFPYRTSELRRRADTCPQRDLRLGGFKRRRDEGDAAPVGASGEASVEASAKLRPVSRLGSVEKRGRLHNLLSSLTTKDCLLLPLSF